MSTATNQNMSEGKVKQRNLANVGVEESEMEKQLLIARASRNRLQATNRMISGVSPKIQRSASSTARKRRQLTARSASNARRCSDLRCEYVATVQTTQQLSDGQEEVEICLIAAQRKCSTLISGRNFASNTQVIVAANNPGPRFAYLLHAMP